MPSEKKSSIPELDHTNYAYWASCIISELCRKDVLSVIDDSPPTAPSAPAPTTSTTTTTTRARASSTGSAGATPTTTTVAPSVVSAADQKKYETDLAKWRTSDNIAAGIITQNVSRDLRHLYQPRDSAKDIWQALEAHHMKTSSGAHANNLRIQLVDKRYNDGDDFEIHISFFREINSQLVTVKAGFEDSFLAWLLCHSLPKTPGNLWSITTSSIFATCSNINALTFQEVAEKLREAYRSDPQSGKSNDRNALRASAPRRYEGEPCTYSGCRYPRSHGYEECRKRLADEKHAKEDRGKKAKKHAKVVVRDESSDEDSEVESEQSGEEEPVTQKKHKSKSKKATLAVARKIKAFAAWTPSLPPDAILRLKTNMSQVTSAAIIAYIDSGCSQHMSPEYDWFDPSTLMKLKKKLPIYLGDDSIIKAHAIGTIRFHFNVNGEVFEGAFKNVLYVPKLKATLLSIRQTMHTGHTKVVFDGTICEYIDKKTNEVLARAIAHDDSDLYVLDATPITSKVRSNTATSTRSSDINLLHRRLGHLGFDSILKLVSHGMVLGVDKITGAREFCEGCAIGNSKKLPHPVTNTTTSRSLERVHIDLCGEMPPSFGNNKHFLLIIDEHTRYFWVEFLRHKGQAFEKFKTWKLRVETEATTQLKELVLIPPRLHRLKSDNGGEFKSEEFDKFLESEGVTHDFSAPYSHEQNGLVERGIQTVSRRALCMIHGGNMPVGLWPHAVETAVFHINRSPAAGLKNKTPFEAWTGHKPSIHHLRPFGCWAYAHIPMELQRKFGPKARRCRLIGFVSHSTNYKLWDPITKQVFICHDVIFDERPISSLPPEAPVDFTLLDSAFGHLSAPPENIDPPVEIPLQHLPETQTDDNSDSESGSSNASEVEDLVYHTLDDIMVPEDHDPIVPELPRPAERRRVRPEHERIADARGPAPSNPTRRPRITLATTDADEYTTHGHQEFLNALHAAPQQSSPFDIPRTPRQALDGNDGREWYKAMHRELESIQQNGTFEQVTMLPAGRKAVDYKWVYDLKFNPDGSIARHKARLVAKGFSQIPGQDYTDTGITSPVARLASYRTLLALAAKLDLEAHHLDVETAFLYGELEEEIYMKAPHELGDYAPGQVVRLRKSLYGLKQASRVWNRLLDKILKELGFQPCQSDTCVYIYKISSTFIILAVHVDDMLIVSNDIPTLNTMKGRLSEHFKIKDLGEVKFLLGIEIIRDRHAGIIQLSQRLYVDQMVARYNATREHTVKTPLRSAIRLSNDDCPTTPQAKLEMGKLPYASLVGSLMYAMTGTRPDIAFAVGALSRFLGNPGHVHWEEARRVLRYLNGTRDFVIQYKRDTAPIGRVIGYSRGIVPASNQPTEFIEGFTDSDWAGCVDTRRSTSGFVWMMSGGPISWRSRLQSIVALSSTEAEYVGATPAAQEVMWLRQLLLELQLVDDTPSLLHVDNAGAVALTHNSDSRRTKHIDLRYHFIRWNVENRNIRVQYLPTDEMIADIMTKNLDRLKFEYFIKQMGMVTRSSGGVKI